MLIIFSRNNVLIRTFVFITINIVNRLNYYQYFFGNIFCIGCNITHFYQFTSFQIKAWQTDTILILFKSNFDQ